MVSLWLTADLLTWMLCTFGIWCSSGIIVLFRECNRLPELLNRPIRSVRLLVCRPTLKLILLTVTCGRLLWTRLTTVVAPSRRSLLLISRTLARLLPLWKVSQIEWTLKCLWPLSRQCLIVLKELRIRLSAQSLPNRHRRCSLWARFLGNTLPPDSATGMKSVVSSMLAVSTIPFGPVSD